MLSKYDISKLQDLPIEQVAEALNLEVKRHKSLCPFHSDSRPSLTFNRNKNKYRCYVCDAKGGTIDLAMHMNNLSFRDACHWLAQSFGIHIDDLAGSQYSEAVSNRGQRPRIVPREVKPAWKAVPEEKPDIPYLTRLMAQPIINERAAKFLFEDRKISREVVRKIGLSSIAYNCPMSSSPKPTYFDGPALLIPYRDIDGNLISVQSRYLGSDDRPRFRFPKGSHCSIFNLPALKDCKPQEPVFITEGVTDCLAMLSAGFKAIAIPSATLLSESDKQQLLSLSSSLSLYFHMYPDNDEPGAKLFEELKKLLPSLTRHRLPEGFKDVGQYYAFIHRQD